jgi:hypothetical protein
MPEALVSNNSSNEAYQQVAAKLSSLVSQLSCRGASVDIFAIIIC